MDILKKLDILIYQIIRPVVVVIGLGVALLLVIGIVSRSVLGTPVFGLEEIMLLAIMWFYMMGAVLASREGSHLKADLMDVLTDNPKVLRIVGMIATVISILASLAFCYWAMDFLAFSMSRWQTTPVFKIPFWISQVSILLAAILLTAYLLRDLVMLWRGDAPVTTSDKDV
ncbi:TRAP transporter small permease [Paracoccus aurantiacus]|uniref:TRAP transporter small permease n=1 Tax=Paracoccus aurantiacus TaxID=2599412 RepID=UPI00164AC1DE|nr:TRAP transporter small permease subunit [Paracoccus aurantiacus]